MTDKSNRRRYIQNSAFAVIRFSKTKKKSSNYYYRLLYRVTCDYVRQLTHSGPQNLWRIGSGRK